MKQQAKLIALFFAVLLFSALGSFSKAGASEEDGRPMWNPLKKNTGTSPTMRDCRKSFWVESSLYQQFQTQEWGLVTLAICVKR
tara:strand:+ start:247 stop:498 length:252 start_codon:yes stop_codon:yes gene_type:complete